MNGKSFEEDLVIDNLSSSGLYMRLPRFVRTGDRLFILIRLSVSEDSESAARIAARGVVVRAEPLDDGRCGAAVTFTRRRFM